MADHRLLTVQRNNDFNARIRKVKVRLDGTVICKIRANEVKTVPITSGSHVLTAKLDWITSNILPIDVKESDVTCEVRFPSNNRPWYNVFKPSTAFRMMTIKLELVPGGPR